MCSGLWATTCIAVLCGTWQHGNRSAVPRPGLRTGSAVACCRSAGSSQAPRASQLPPQARQGKEGKRKTRHDTTRTALHQAVRSSRRRRVFRVQAGPGTSRFGHDLTSHAGCAILRKRHLLNPVLHRDEHAVYTVQTAWQGVMEDYDSRQGCRGFFYIPEVPPITHPYPSPMPNTD